MTLAHIPSPDAPRSWGPAGTEDGGGAGDTILAPPPSPRVRDRFGEFERTTPDVWQEVNCQCRDDGPWVVSGPEPAAYACARCGRLLDRRAL